MTIKNSARAPCTELHYTSPLCLCARIRSSQDTPMLKEVRLPCDVMDMGGCNWLVHLCEFSFIWWQTICEVRYYSVEHASEFHVITVHVLTLFFVPKLANLGCFVHVHCVFIGEPLSTSSSHPCEM